MSEQRVEPTVSVAIVHKETGDILEIESFLSLSLAAQFMEAYVNQGKGHSVLICPTDETVPGYIDEHWVADHQAAAVLS